MNKFLKLGFSTLTLSAMIGGAFAATDSTGMENQTAAATMTGQENNTADASYTIGYSIGKNMVAQLKQQDVNLNFDKLQSGFSDGVKGQKPTLSQSQMEQALKTFQADMEAKLKAQAKEKPSDNANTSVSSAGMKDNSNTSKS